MKISTHYECPVCNKPWEKESEAIICRNKHIAIKKQWYECEICGAGWNPKVYGEKTAAENAKKCEQSHKDKGEVEEISRMTFFMYGGKKGKYYQI